MSKKIILEDLIAEASAAAAIDFAAAALNSAIHRIITESGGITKNEVETIEKIYEKVITEAMEEFVPSEDEIQEIIAKLEAAGYKVVKAEEIEAEEAPAEEPAAEDEVPAPAEEPVEESVDLAAKIAAKLEIL